MDLFEGNKGLYRTVLDFCKEAVMLFDTHGYVVFANNAAITELGYEDGMAGVNITQVFPMIIRMERGRVEWENVAVMQTFAYRQNQTCYPVKLSVNWISEVDNMLGVCYAVDDSERYNAVRSHKKAIEQVTAANKMKNEFTANITHELRTPINGIKGMASGLADTELDSAQSETVAVILRCCENMNKIINDVLDFSKIEAGKLQVEFREFSFQRFLDETLAFNIVRINEKGLKLIVNVDSKMPEYVIGDELRLGQVLNNLFSNAIKFTKTGHIGLEINCHNINDEDIELFFVVIDTGIGIAPEEKDKLFQSFSQVDGSITRRFGGTGLGLAISKQLVELMGGTIKVESEKGKGSSFSFSVRFKRGKTNKGRINFPQGKFVYDKQLVPSRQPQAETEEQSGDYYNGNNTYNDSGYQDAANLSDSELEKAENLRTISDLLERITICVELGSWEKAEDFASTIRNLAPQEDRDWKSMSFQLVLNVRKENYEKSIEIIAKLREKAVEEQNK